MDLLTQTELAAVLRVDVSTIKRWSAGRKPRIPCVRIFGTVRYHLPTVLKAGVDFTTEPTKP
jgi:DNA-binding transcriptional regulator YiaG